MKVSDAESHYSKIHISFNTETSFYVFFGKKVLSYNLARHVT